MQMSTNTATTYTPQVIENLAVELVLDARSAADAAGRPFYPADLVPAIRELARVVGTTAAIAAVEVARKATVEVDPAAVLGL